MRKIKKLFQNEMVNTSLYTGIGTVIAQISGFVVSKVIALSLGTVGIAMVSQFMDFITMSTSLATGGIQHGVVKYVAEFKNDRDELSKILSTSFKMTLYFSIFISSVIFIFSNQISNSIFKTIEYSFVICVFSVNIILFALNTLIIKILNGLSDVTKLVKVSISNSLFGLFITTFIAFYFGLEAVLITLSISQSIVFFISLYIVKKTYWFNFSFFKLGVDKINLFRFLKFSLIGICMMVIAPLLNLGIRDLVISKLSTEDAGIWSGLIRISNSYLGIITLTLSYYYLPKLSSLINPKDIKKEIIIGYKIITPFVLFVILIIYFFRVRIITLIYTREFLTMKGLFAIQLAGDYFKIMSFLLSYLMLAKAKTKMFINTTIFFSLFLYITSSYLITTVGLIGVVYAYLINYIIYFITMIILFRKYLNAN